MAVGLVNGGSTQAGESIPGSAIQLAVWLSGEALPQPSGFFMRRRPEGKASATASRSQASQAHDLNGGRDVPPKLSPRQTRPLPANGATV